MYYKVSDLCNIGVHNIYYRQITLGLIVTLGIMLIGCLKELPWSY